MKEQMNVHKALSELKTLDARISKAIDELNVVVQNKHNNTKISGLPVAEYAAEAKKAYQSVNTLISRRNAIKRAVTRSNAVTMVQIAGKEYTVAEAIDMKSKGVAHLSMLKDRLMNQYAKAKRFAESGNNDLDDRADAYIQSLYQGADLKNMSDEIKKVRDTFVTAQTVEIIDPIGVAGEIEQLQNEIDEFLTDVDSALSVSNALTVVDVEYETK